MTSMWSSFIKKMRGDPDSYFKYTQVMPTFSKVNRGSPCGHSVNIVNKQSVINHVLLPLEHVECFDNDLGSQ